MRSVNEAVWDEVLYYVARYIRWRVSLPVAVVSLCLLFVASAMSAETVSFTVRKKDYISWHDYSGSLHTLFWYLDPCSASIPAVHNG